MSRIQTKQDTSAVVGLVSPSTLRARQRRSLRGYLCASLLAATCGCSAPSLTQSDFHLAKSRLPSPLPITQPKKATDAPFKSTPASHVPAGVTTIVPASFGASTDLTIVDEDAAVAGPVEPPAIPEVPFAPSVDTAAMSLEDFVSIAVANNPAIQQLIASTRKAAGYREQVGLKPNPTVGYQAVQLADQGTDQHTAFVEQEFVTGNKLQLNRRVLNHAVQAQNYELSAQRMRVLTDVRVKFIEALTAQQKQELLGELKSVTEQALTQAELRVQALEGNQLEVLQARIQSERIALLALQADAELDAAWRELVAISGLQQLPQTRLQGSLQTDTQLRDWGQVQLDTLNLSPEYHAATARLQAARANLDRQRAQPLPNLTVQLATGIDNATDSGLINLEVGAPIPIFNKNQGNIAAANAEYCRALAETKRIEQSIMARVGAISGEFERAQVAVEKYNDQIVPDAKRALDMAEETYRAGHFSFIETLVVRRSYLQARLSQLAAQSELAAASTQLDGFVLTGALEPTADTAFDDGLRGLTFSQQ